MTQFSLRKLVKPAMLGGAMLGLSACAYGGGSYGDNYVNGGGYACDPYAPFDDYYACDNGYGYANIGYGGGWYDNFYYPGYGIYIFDRGGSRYSMRNNHRRYWARKRAEYRSHHRRPGGQRDWDRRDRRQDLTPAQRAERRERRAERRRDWTPEQRAERRERRTERRRDWTPEQRAERRERRAERRRDWTPEQRAERRERRTERRDRRATEGNRTPGQRTERRERRNERGDRGRTQRGNRQDNSARTERRTRPAVQQNRTVQQRQAPATRAEPRAVPKARTPARNSRSVVSREKVNKD